MTHRLRLYLFQQTFCQPGSQEWAGVTCVAFENFGHLFEFCFLLLDQGPVLFSSQNFWVRVSGIFWVALLFFLHFGTIGLVAAKPRKPQNTEKPRILLEILGRTKNRLQVSQIYIGNCIKASSHIFGHSYLFIHLGSAQECGRILKHAEDLWPFLPLRSDPSDNFSTFFDKREETDCIRAEPFLLSIKRKKALRVTNHESANFVKFRSDSCQKRKCVSCFFKSVKS